MYAVETINLTKIFRSARNTLAGLVIGEERSFYWRLTGRENLEFFGVLHNLSLREVRRRSEAIMELLEIEDPDKRFYEYSTGNKQKLALGRCLLSNPTIVPIQKMRAINMSVSFKPCFTIYCFLN